MSLCCWMVFSVKGEKGTGMNAFSWAAVWIWLPLLRAATSLLVPTSRPTGLLPETRFSIFSWASSATFHR